VSLVFDIAHFGFFHGRTGPCTSSTRVDPWSPCGAACNECTFVVFSFRLFSRDRANDANLRLPPCTHRRNAIAVLFVNSPQ